MSRENVERMTVYNYREVRDQQLYREQCTAREHVVVNFKDFVQHNSQLMLEIKQKCLYAREKGDLFVWGAAIKRWNGLNASKAGIKCSRLEGTFRKNLAKISR